jgi:hypothetical protein
MIRCDEVPYRSRVPLYFVETPKLACSIFFAGFFLPAKFKAH